MRTGIYIIVSLLLTVPTCGLPVCNAGIKHTIEVGSTGQLDASGSSGSGTLSYVWSAVAPTEARVADNHLLVNFSSTTSQQPTVSGAFVTGPLNFHLVVTDITGSSSCDVHDGAVAVGANKVIIEPDPVWELLQGPLTEMDYSIAMTGSPIYTTKNPWPFADYLEQNYADHWGQIAGQVPSGANSLGVSYIPEWEFPKTGTCDLVNGSTNVNCSGTQLETDFRGGATSGSPTHSDYVVVLYPYNGCASNCFASTSTYGAHYTSATINAQTGAGAMTLNPAWPLANCTGCKVSAYATWDAANSRLLQSWFGASTNNSYYDMAKAMYEAWKRTGIEDYIKYARWYARRWFDNPYIDKLTTHNAPRFQNLEGLVMYLMDQESQGGTGDVRAGIEDYCENGVKPYALDSTNYPIGGKSDQREEAANLWWLGLCAISHSDATKRASYVTLGDNLLKGRWTTYRRPDGSWRGLGLSCTICSTDGSLGKIFATNGSTAVTLTGATWSAGQFLNAGTTGVIKMGTLTMGSYPLTYDARGYKITRTGSTTGTLDAPYEGVTDTTNGKAFNLTGGGGTSDWALDVAQPFMEGFIASALSVWSYALKHATTPDLAEAAIIDNTWLPELALWFGNSDVYNDDLSSAGTGRHNRGPFYGVGGGVCETPYGPSGNAGNCGGAANEVQSRELSPELVKAFAFGYCTTKNASIITIANNYYSAMFAKYATDAGYDGAYVGTAISPNGIDYEIGPDAGYWTSYQGKANPFFFGIGQSEAWPAALAGCKPTLNISIIHRVSKTGRFGNKRRQ